MDPSEVYKVLISCANVLRKCAEVGNEEVFKDEFCVVFVVDGKSVVVGRNGEVYIHEQRSKSNLKLKGKKNKTNSNFSVPERESVAPTPNSYGLRWTRGQKEELELCNTLESLLNNSHN